MLKMEPRTHEQLLEIKNRLLTTTDDTLHVNKLYSIVENFKDCSDEFEEELYTNAFDELVYIYMEDM